MKPKTTRSLRVLFALAALVVGGRAAAQPAPMTAPTSSNITIPYGTPLPPPYSGGSGGNTYIFCVADYTNWQAAGWTPPGVGTYTFWVGLLPSAGFQGNIDDPLIGNLACDGTPYTLTVVPAAMSAPTSASVTIVAGTPWTPAVSGGTGGAGPIFCVADYTNWQAGSWTPPSPGTYTFWVGLQPATGYQGNIDDPLFGNLESDGMQYTLTVVPAGMSAPTSANVTVAAGTPWTPTYSGGGGGTNYIFCVAGYTNWQAESWTPQTPGTYTFWVGLQPSPGYEGNINDPLFGNLECDGAQYTLTVE